MRWQTIVVIDTKSQSHTAKTDDESVKRIWIITWGLKRE